MLDDIALLSRNSGNAVRARRENGNVGAIVRITRMRGPILQRTIQFSRNKAAVPRGGEPSPQLGRVEPARWTSRTET